MHRLISILVALVLATSAFAQRYGRGNTQITAAMKQRNALVDSIDAVGKKYAVLLDSLAAAADNSSSDVIAGSSTADGRNGDGQGISTTSLHENPYYFPLFASGTLMPGVLRYTLGSISEPTVAQRPIMPRALPTIAWTLAETYALHPEVINAELVPASVVINNPLKTLEEALPNDRNNNETRQEAQHTANAPISVEKEKHTDTDYTFDLSDFHIHVRRPNFWDVRGSYSTQFMQYYVSDNWYKGGENHVSMLAAFNIEANYNNKQRLTFSNKLETKLGFQTSPSDTYHKFKTNADLLRLTDKLGIQASKHWYYTVMLQSWTQFYKAYKSNSADVASDFMSPFETVFSIGMDYKLQKKRVNLTATLSPAAANFKYCDRELLVKNYGIEEGKHLKRDLGSTVTINMTLKFCEQVNWVTRFYAFYDYKEHLKAEWENTINLKINKYLSTKLFLYPRFDNSVTKKNEDDSYFQFNEYLSVGLDLNF